MLRHSSAKTRLLSFNSRNVNEDDRLVFWDSETPTWSLARRSLCRRLIMSLRLLRNSACTLSDERNECGKCMTHCHYSCVSFRLFPYQVYLNVYSSWLHHSAP